MGGKNKGGLDGVGHLDGGQIVGQRQQEAAQGQQSRARQGVMLHQGQWINQEELWEHIWEADADPFSNVIRMHISSLRRKLRERLGHDPIETKIGRGYRLNEEAAL